MRKKAILYIITKSAWGGAGKYVYDLATNLPQTKFRAMVAAGPADGGTSERGELARKLSAAGIPYFEIKNFQRNISIFKEIFAYFEILLLLLKIRPDIIHVNSAKAGGVAGVAAWDYKILTLNFGVKSIFTAHGWTFHENRPKWQIFLIKLFSKITCFYYSKIICVSEFDRQSAIKNRIAPARKLITIHNGIKIGDYNFLEKEEARKNICKTCEGPTFAECIWIGTIGEFTKNKGQEYLIDAIKLLVARYPLLVTLIIGWGEEFENLKLKIENLKLEGIVFLINNLVNPSNFLRAFDIFVLPSVKEGLPYSLLEAGLAELPIIATDVGGIPEIIGYNEGLLVKPADAEKLAGAIEDLIENSEKRKLMAANLRQKILREFFLEKMLNATLAAYEENRGAGK